MNILFFSPKSMPTTDPINPNQATSAENSHVAVSSNTGTQDEFDFGIVNIPVAEKAEPVPVENPLQAESVADTFDFSLDLPESYDANAPEEQASIQNEVMASDPVVEQVATSVESDPVEEIASQENTMFQNPVEEESTVATPEVAISDSDTSEDSQVNKDVLLFAEPPLTQNEKAGAMPSMEETVPLEPTIDAQEAHSVLFTPVEEPPQSTIQEKVEQEHIPMLSEEPAPMPEQPLNLDEMVSNANIQPMDPFAAMKEVVQKNKKPEVERITDHFEGVEEIPQVAQEPAAESKEKGEEVGAYEVSSPMEMLLQEEPLPAEIPMALDEPAPVPVQETVQEPADIPMLSEGPMPTPQEVLPKQHVEEELSQSNVNIHPVQESVLEPTEELQLQPHFETQLAPESVPTMPTISLDDLQNVADTMSEQASVTPTIDSAAPTLDLDALTAPINQETPNALTTPFAQPSVVQNTSNNKKLIGFVFGGIGLFVLVGGMLFLRYPDLLASFSTPKTIVTEKENSGEFEHFAPEKEDEPSIVEAEADSGEVDENVIVPVEPIEITGEFSGGEEGDIHTIVLEAGDEENPEGQITPEEKTTPSDLLNSGETAPSEHIEENDPLSTVESLVGPINEDPIKKEITEYLTTATQLYEQGVAQDKRTVIKYALAVKKNTESLLQALENGENIDISKWSSKKQELDEYLAIANDAQN